MADVPQLGDIIEAYCEKCRLNLDVSVAAVADGEIQQVQCRTCNNFVPYKEPVPDSVKKDRAFKRVLRMRDRKSGAGRQPVVTQKGTPPPKQLASRTPGIDPRWVELTDDMDSTRAVPYTPQRRYSEGDYLLHKSFGMGYVEAVEDGEEGPEAKVLFRNGHQLLACNRED